MLLWKQQGENKSEPKEPAVNGVTEGKIQYPTNNPRSTEKEGGKLATLFKAAAPVKTKREKGRSPNGRFSQILKKACLNGKKKKNTVQRKEDFPEQRTLLSGAGHDVPEHRKEGSIKMFFGLKTMTTGGVLSEKQREGRKK